jgi:hypothetical protein
VVRYHDVIPSTFADPVKSSLAAAATGTTVRRRKTPTLFGDDPEDEDGAKPPGPELDVDGDQDMLHDFLDDDLGDFLKEDNDAEAKFRGGRVEVGQLYPLSTQHETSNTS